MTSQRSFKSRVRQRMARTGESYTVARRHLLSRLVPEPAVVAAPEGGRTQQQRISTALLRDRTGHGWEEWFARLDAWGAVERTHTDTARWLVTTHEVPGWWAQTITVGYEQARGLRAPGQRRGGGYDATATRTVAVPVARLYAAFVDEAVRRRWLSDADLRLRTATAPRSYRADWAGGPSRIVVGFTAVNEAKARVAVLHEKLADAEESARYTAYWRDRLGALKQLLESAEVAR